MAVHGSCSCLKIMVKNNSARCALKMSTYKGPWEGKDSRAQFAT